MRRILKRRPSPALVVALLALFVALGGASYAATALPRNSVGPLQLRANAVSSGKVQNRSLLAVDFKTGQIPKGPKGDTGPPGPAGAAGAAGPPGLSGVQVVTSFGSGGTGTRTDTANCPSGKKAIGGGFSTANVDSASNLSVLFASVQDDGTSYQAQVKNSSASDTWNLTARVICATVT